MINTGRAVEWKFPVRAEHLLHGTGPVPAEMADRTSPHEPLDLTFPRGRRRIGVLDRAGVAASIGPVGDAYDCQSFRTGSRKDQRADGAAIGLFKT
ncbi:hypothetical protein WJ438_16680 [Streptomyces sp. GD-15H]|uniref:hypothetical protein n=1 Tax=Streptomyces sp. GD-15H TaxID=3129112 RepID=UPI003244F5DE